MNPDSIDTSEEYYSRFSTAVQNKSNDELAADHSELVKSLFESLLFTIARYRDIAEYDRRSTCQNTPVGDPNRDDSRHCICDKSNRVDFRYVGPFRDLQARGGERFRRRTPTPINIDNPHSNRGHHVAFVVGIKDRQHKIDLYCIELDKRKLQQVTYYSESQHRLITTTVFNAFLDSPITYEQLGNLLQQYYQIPSSVYGTGRRSPTPDR